MSNETLLRQHVVNLLTSKEAHANFESAIKGLPVTLRGDGEVLPVKFASPA